MKTAKLYEVYKIRYSVFEAERLFTKLATLLHYFTVDSIVINRVGNDYEIEIKRNTYEEIVY
jgi:hypothetical protein